MIEKEMAKLALTVEEAIKAHTIQLKTPEGDTGDSVTVAGSVFQGKVKEKKVPYVLPDGYKRFSFKGDTSTAGGSAWVRWATNDEHDATVIIHADCGPNGKARAAVSECYGIEE